MRKREYIISELKCPVCGQIMTVPRYKSAKREKGHIKTMFCPICKKKRQFRQLDEWGRDDDGKRITPELPR